MSQLMKIEVWLYKYLPWSLLKNEKEIENTNENNQKL